MHTLSEINDIVHPNTADGQVWSTAGRGSILGSGALAFAVLFSGCNAEPTKSASAIAYESVEKVYPGNIDYGQQQQVEPDPATRDVMQRNGGINIIYIPVETVNQEGLSSSFRGFANGDPDIMNLFAKGMTNATHGRYTPREVSSTTLSPVSLGKTACFDYDLLAHHKQVQQAALSGEKLGAINIIAVGASACDGESVAKAYSGDKFPIVSNNTSNVALPVIAMHEIGHGIGGAHAGVVTCDGEVPSSCGSDVVKNPYAAADKYSLMSYTGKDRTGLVFSSVDMEMMGLLSPREVIRANSAGSYTVSPFSVVGAKLLQLPGDVYVSVEALNLKDGPRNVVQVRALQKFEDTGDTFPMRVETPDMTAEEKEQGGFTQPGSTVAELPGFKVTLEGIKHDGTATLVVTKA